MVPDVYGIKDTLQTWFPSVVKERMEPLADRAEQTIKNLDSHILRTITDSVSKKQVTNVSLDNHILNKIHDQIIPIEGKLDNLDRHITEKIDLALLPKEAIPIGGVVFGGQLHGGTNIDCIGGQAFIRQTVEGKINTIPTGQPCLPQTTTPYCPPTGTGGDQICPPCEPCPAPVPPIQVNVYKRHCKEKEDACIYIVPTGYPKLADDDVSIVDGALCTLAILEIFANMKYVCPEIPFCETKLLPPGCCPPPKLPQCPGMIINVQPPPGGQIENITPPFQQLQPDQIPPIEFPPYTQTVPPGSIVNLAMVAGLLPGQQKCFPSGDYSLALQICDDGTKTMALSKQLFGASINSFIEDKTPVDWWKEQYEKIKSSLIPWDTITLGEQK